MIPDNFRRRTPVIVIFAVAIAGAVIVITPIILCLLVIRRIVLIFAQKTRPDLDGFVHGSHNVFAMEPSPVTPVSNILVLALWEGQISPEKFQQNMEERVLNLRSPDGNNFLYKGLRRTWTNFLGFAFWTSVTNFKIQNHVRTYDYSEIPNPCSEADIIIIKVLGNLAQRGWDSGQSPWEILIIPNVLVKGVSQTGMVIRFDHVLGDGYSLMGWMKKLLGSSFTTPNLQQNKARALTAFEKLALFWKIPFDMAECSLMALFPRSISGYPKKGVTQEPLTVSISGNIPLDLVKLVRKKFSVSFVTVIFTVIVGAIGRALELSGQVVPEYLTGGVVVPLPNHPGGMTVHCSYLLAEFPVLRTQSSVGRLLEIQKVTTELTKSSAALGYLYMGRVISYFPTFIRQRLLKALVYRDLPLTITNFPTTSSKESMDGHEVLYIAAILGTPPSMGLTITTGGVNGRQRFNFSIHDNVFTTPEASMRLGKFVEEELQELVNATNGSGE
ncbi:unnamed protein product [Allacma fusca]|uniref:O-acyltransferase WSD1 C-terminal domain-containing protein n=1 Tax=Allacma fusca TaxID=39272 RepID=A0A8J2KNI3_9HEXA|nr:unnamed protein product [Allacma fusca]